MGKIIDGTFFMRETKRKYCDQHRKYVIGNAKVWVFYGYAERKMLSDR